MATTASKHWLHKTPEELLAGIEPPLELLRVRLFIKYQQNIFAVLGADGDATKYGVPAIIIEKGSPNSLRPISDLVLETLAPTFADSIVSPQLMEFGFPNPIATPVETRLDMAVIISPTVMHGQWTLQDFGAKRLLPMTGEPMAEAFAGRVVHRIKGMENWRMPDTQVGKSSARLEILRAIGGCIRHVELTGHFRNQNPANIAILEPTDVDKPQYPQIGLYLVTVSAYWMNEIRMSTKAMDLSHQQGPSGTLIGLRTFRVIGWIDRRRGLEQGALADTEWALEKAFRYDRSVCQIWIPSRVGDREFYLKTGDPQLAMDKWAGKLVMGI